MESINKDIEDKIPMNDLDVWSDAFGQRIYEFVEKTIPIFNDDNYIKLMLDNLVTDKVASTIYKPTIIEKNSTTATKHLIKANFFYLNKNDVNLNSAYDEYTKCIINAPKKSKELSIGYANRSKLLCDMKLYSDCLLDIGRAVINGYPNCLKSKLYLRKAECLQALNTNNHPDVTKIFIKIKKYIDIMDPNEKQDFIKKVNQQEKLIFDKKYIFPKWNYDNYIPKLKHENSMIPGLSELIKLKYSNEFGRHFVAAKNIKPGETLAVVKPYVKIYFPETKYKFCCHCGQQSWSSVPCNNCIEVIYCSEICKNNANKEYHDIECQVLSSLRQYDLIDDQFIIYPRIISKAIKEAGGCVDNLFSDLDKIDAELEPLKKGFINNIFDNKKFTSIYSLSNNLPNDDLKTSIHAYPILIAYLFATKTTFFGTKLNENLNELKDNKKFILLIKLIQKLMLINSTNRSSIMILNENYKIQKVFYGIYPSVCFFNHSCNSTLVSSIQGDTLIMTTANSIKKGEQIFYNYGPHYKNQLLVDRQMELKEHYNFKCNCIACINNWPMNFAKLSSLRQELEDQHYLELLIKLIKVNDKLNWATNSLVKFGKTYSNVPNVSLEINDMINIIDKSTARYGKNSKQTLFIVSKFEKFLSNWNNPYVSLQ